MAITNLSLSRPQTKVAKRFSSLFLGEGVACECGPGGQEASENIFKSIFLVTIILWQVSEPHECPKMGDTPDLVTSHKAEAATGLGEEKSKELMAMLKQSTRTGGKRIVIREDPHRRCYKRLVALAFLGGTLLYLVLDLAFQIQSVSGSQYFCCCKIFFRHPRNILLQVLVRDWEEVEVGAGLATALLPATYLKQILNPVILIYAEFCRR